MSKADTLASMASDTFGGFAFRNKVINPRFEFWQRGITFAASTGYSYTADRWARNSLGSTVAVDQQAFTLGQTEVDAEPRYFARVTVASVAGAGNYAVFSHRIEGVRTLAGKKLTITFNARTTSAPKNIAVELLQAFGTGGSPSATVNVQAQTQALTTTFGRYSLTFDIPSISGKTLGTGGDDHLELRFWLDAGSSFNARLNNLGQQSGVFDFADVQIEQGDAYTSFGIRPAQVELAMCQRYFETSYDRLAPPGTAQTAGAECARAVGTTHDVGVRFRVNKRATPTITLYNPAAANTPAQWRDTIANVSKTASSNNPGETGFSVQVASTVAGNTVMGHWTADAEL